MPADPKLVQAVLEAAVEQDGCLKLTCSQAFAIARRFGVKPIEVGKICNQNNVKIRACQLGCFK